MAALSCLDVYGPRPIAIDFSELRFKVTTADVYPASLRGLIDHRREPRWIFARFHLNGAKALAEAMVAVGTLITERPPHRSRRALLTHRAPTLDGDEEPLLRPRMQDAWILQVPVRDRLHSVPR
jgi:hypothetical protein